MFSNENIKKILNCVKNAGIKAQNLRDQGLKIEIKNDGSKVTNADKELDVILSDFIKNELNSKDLIISEEDVGNGNCPEATKEQSYWSIDPIDSTLSFIKGYPYWTLNIAFINNGCPSFGLIHSPDLETTWYGIVGDKAYKKVGNNEVQTISVRETPSNGTTLISSELQIVTRQLKEELDVAIDIKVPSSLKFTYIAEGKADYYTRVRNNACEWDISAGHALIVAAGGSLEFINPEENFQYGKYPYKAPALIAKGKPRTK